MTRRPTSPAACAGRVIQSCAKSATVMVQLPSPLLLPLLKTMLSGVAPVGAESTRTTTEWNSEPSASIAARSMAPAPPILIDCPSVPAIGAGGPENVAPSATAPKVTAPEKLVVRVELAKPATASIVSTSTWKLRVPWRLAGDLT